MNSAWKRAASVLCGLFALIVAGACSPGGTALAAGNAAEGKKVYEAHKCQRCHKPGGKRDLAGVGKKRKADWLTAYLKGEQALDGKKHKKKFKGSDAELKALVQWLMSLD